jgi:hypothetical protein
MSGAQQTQAAQLRSLAATTLLAQNTIAATRVEQERTLPLAAGDLPHLNVFVDESGAAEYQGGPRFKVTAKLMIKGTVQRARLADAVADLDTLTYQIKDALLCDPVWIKLANQVLSFNVTGSFKSDQEQHQGEVLMTFSCEYLETIALRGPVAITGEDITTQAGIAGVTAPIVSSFTIST